MHFCIFENTHVYVRIYQHFQTTDSEDQLFCCPIKWRHVAWWGQGPIAYVSLIMTAPIPYHEEPFDSPIPWLLCSLSLCWPAAWEKSMKLNNCPVTQPPGSTCIWLWKPLVEWTARLYSGPGQQYVFKQTIARDSKAEQASPACPTGGAAMCKKSCVCWRLPLLDYRAA